MGSINTPELGEPLWSVRTALAFLILWAALMVAIQTVASLAVGYLITPHAADVQQILLHLQSWPGFPALSVVCLIQTWAITFGLLYGSLRPFSLRAIGRALGVKTPVPGWSVLAAVPLGVLVCLLAQVLADLLHAGDQTTGFDELMKSRTGQISVGFLALFLAPTAEELFFRGFVYPPLERLMEGTVGSRIPARCLAVLANASVFALPHVFVYFTNVGYLLAVLLLGVLAASLRAWTGSVWPGMFAHFCFNGSSLLLYFLQP